MHNLLENPRCSNLISSLINTARQLTGNKPLSYSAKELNAAYNGRLQLTSFEVRKPNNDLAMSSSHQYYADGALKFSNDGLDERFDRAYRYDHIGRATEAYSGSEARDFINGTNTGPATGADHQTYQYNPFNQVTQQTNRLWSDTQTTTSTFVNNRQEGWSYDSAGEILFADGITYTHDAVGRVVASASESATRANKYDGDGRLAWTSLTRPNFRGIMITTTTYYLGSTVLGGLAAAGLNSSGQKTIGYIYAGSRKVAQAAGTYITWSHEEPVTGSRGDTTAEGYYSPKAEYNADGVDIGFTDPALSDPGGTEIPEPVFLGANFGLGSSCSNADPNCVSCYLDGIETDCGHVARLVETGAAEQCPNNDCGPRRVIGADGKPRLDPLTTDPRTGQLVYGYWYWERVGVVVRDPADGEIISSTPGTLHFAVDQIPSTGLGGMFLAAADIGRQEYNHPQNPMKDGATGTPCSDALAVANATTAGVNRAFQNEGILKDVAAQNGNVIDWKVLGAIGIRESDFRNIAETGGGPGIAAPPSSLGPATSGRANTLSNEAKKKHYPTPKDLARH